MTDKERLEMLKNRSTFDNEDIDWLIRQTEELHGTKGRHGYKGMWGLCNRDYAHLNEENETLKKRVQELENLCEQLIGEEWMNDEGLYESEMMKLKKRNQCYKQALGKIKNKVNQQLEGLDAEEQLQKVRVLS
jgi:hypothetical protein